MAIPAEVQLDSLPHEGAKTYGTTNLAGNGTLDAALQLALWDLSLPHTVDPNNPFTSSAGSDPVYFTADVNGAIESELKTLLNDAQGKSATGVNVLFNGGVGTNLQQNVLQAVPEPSGFASWPQPRSSALAGTP